MIGKYPVIRACSFKPDREGDRCPDPPAVGITLDYDGGSITSLSCRHHILATMYRLADTYDMAERGTTLGIEPVDWDNRIPGT